MGDAKRKRNQGTSSKDFLGKRKYTGNGGHHMGDGGDHPGSQGSSSNGNCGGHSQGYRASPQHQGNRNEPTPCPCPGCGKEDRGTTWDGHPIICFSCGTPRHKSNRCN